MCNHDVRDSKVLDTGSRYGVLTRLRECKVCGLRFNTEELRLPYEPKYINTGNKVKRK